MNVKDNNNHLAPGGNVVSMDELMPSFDSIESNLKQLAQLRETYRNRRIVELGSMNMKVLASSTEDELMKIFTSIQCRGLPELSGEELSLIDELASGIGNELAEELARLELRLRLLYRHFIDALKDRTSDEKWEWLDGAAFWDLEISKGSWARAKSGEDTTDHTARSVRSPCVD